MPNIPMSNREQSPQHESALRGVRIEKLPITHEDTRRSFTEFFDSRDIGFNSGVVRIGGIKIMGIKQPADDEETVVGGHWEQGSEVIWVQQGEITTLRLADVNTGEEEIHQHISAATRVILPRLVAHQLRFSGPATLIIMNEIPFSPAKLVIYPPWIK